MNLNIVWQNTGEGTRYAEVNGVIAIEIELRRRQGLTEWRPRFIGEGISTDWDGTEWRSSLRDAQVDAVRFLEMLGHRVHETKEG